MLWYAIFGLIGLVFFKKKYNLTFWQAVWNGIVFGFVLYFGWGTIISLFSLMVGLEAIPIWALILYAFLTSGGIMILTNLKKHSNDQSKKNGRPNLQNMYTNETKNARPGDIIETRVAGVTFEGRQQLIRNLKIKDKIQLRREPNNTYDKNAIQVVISNGLSIGYINRKLAKNIAPIFDKSSQPYGIKGEITSLNRVENEPNIIGVSIKFRLPESNNEDNNIQHNENEDFHLNTQQIQIIVSKWTKSHSGVVPSVNERAEEMIETVQRLFDYYIDTSIHPKEKNYEMTQRIKDELRRFGTLLPLSAAVGVELGKGYIPQDTALELLQLLNEYFLKYFFYIFTEVAKYDESLVKRVGLIIENETSLKEFSSNIITASAAMCKLGSLKCDTVAIVEKIGEPPKSTFISYFLDLYKHKN